MLPVSNRTHIRIVQSRQNRRVKELRGSFAHGARSGNQCVGIEGEHLLQEALHSGLRVQTVFVREGSRDLLTGLEFDAATELLELPANVFASAVTTESPQGVAALVEPPRFSLSDTLRSPRPLVVVVDGLQDPGNLGTLVRSAEAFGASGVIALPGTATVWNPKTLRASSGSVFRLPVASARPEEALKSMREFGITILAAVAAEGEDASRIDLTGPTAIVIGNEGSGVSGALRRRADGAIRIPCLGPVESLNAAVAASVLLYEAARQRLRAK